MFGRKKREENANLPEAEKLKDEVMSYFQNSPETSRVLSDLTGFSESSIENWKHGRNRISLEAAIQVARAVGIQFNLS